MAENTLTISASEFKARCLKVFKDLENRRYARVVVTRRGKPVAELTPPPGKPPALWGAMKDTVNLPPDIDLTEPLIDMEDIDAAKGILHN
jgi:hypothetical protein